MSPVQVGETSLELGTTCLLDSYLRQRTQAYVFSRYTPWVELIQFVPAEASAIRCSTLGLPESTPDTDISEFIFLLFFYDILPITKFKVDNAQFRVARETRPNPFYGLSQQVSRSASSSTYLGFAGSTSVPTGLFSNCALTMASTTRYFSSGPGSDAVSREPGGIV